MPTGFVLYTCMCIYLIEHQNTHTFKMALFTFSLQPFPTPPHFPLPCPPPQIQKKKTNQSFNKAGVIVLLTGQHWFGWCEEGGFVGLLSRLQSKKTKTAKNEKDLDWFRVNGCWLISIMLTTRTTEIWSFLSLHYTKQQRKNNYDLSNDEPRPWSRVPLTILSLHCSGGFHCPVALYSAAYFAYANRDR